MKRLNLLLIFVLFTSIGIFADNYPDFHNAIGTIPNEGTVSIPKATYSLDLESHGTFRITDKKNLHIDGNGSTLICNKQATAFYFSNCENVTFSNFFIEYDPPCSTQGTIIDISNNNKTLEVEIHEGYPMVNPALTQSSMLIYDGETKELIRNFHTTYAASALQIDDVTRKVIFDIGGAKSGVYKVGDYIDFYNVTGGGHAIITEYGKNMKFEKITLYDSPSMAFVEHGCESSHYYRCEINRKKDHPDRPIEQLRSARADGFHCKYDIVGPTIEACTVKYQGDDVVNISGYFYPVYKVNKARKRIYALTTFAEYGRAHVKTGDSLICVNNDGTIRGKGLVTDISGASSSPTQEERNACFGKLTTIRDKDELIYGVSIALDEWIEDLDAGDMIYSANRIGNGFNLLNNNVGHNRSRAFLIKASDGKIQGNTITGSAMSAIAICPEFYWLEAGYSNNLDISNNIISDCMFDENMSGSVQAGAITVACQAPKGTLARVGAFDNISIHRNTITGCPKPCVFLNSVVTGYFYENTLEPDENMVRYHGYNFDVSNRDAYFERYCGNIIKDKDPLGIIHNQIDNPLLIDNDGHVVVNSNDNKNVSLMIYDMLGNVVLTDSFGNRSSVSLKQLPQGIFLLYVAYGNHSYTKKYIVQ